MHFLWRLSVTGGVQNVVRNLLTGLDQDRFELHCVTARPWLAEDRLADIPGVQFHHLDVAGPRTAASRARLAVRAARVLPSLTPDVVHLHSGTAAYAVAGVARSSARLRVLDVHDAPGSGRHGPLSDALEGWLCRRGHVAVAHSTSVRRELENRYALAEQAIRLIPLGVADAHFGPTAMSASAWKQALGVDPTTTLIGYVARVVPTKNVDLFVDVVCDAARRHAGPVHGVVVGGGSEIERLQARLDAEGLSSLVTLVGPRTGQELVDAYGALDLFLSTSDYEGFGLGVVEAMAAGKPVVATAVGGVADLVNDKTTGRLVGRGDRQALTRAVCDLLSDPSGARAAGAAGRERAQALFAVPQMVAGYAALYEEACS